MYVPLSTSSPSPAPAPVATGKGYVSLSAGAPTTPAAAPAATGGYQPISTVGLLAPKSPTAPVSTASPVSTPSGQLGGGYGASNILDAASGKPLLTYENPQAKSSQLLSDRTAPTFDPTKPQVVDSKVLQDPRMKESVSQSIKNAVGGTAYEELDHIMPLELGGSNEKTNLRLEPADNSTQPYSGTNPTPTDPLENQLAAQVHSGQLSLVDAWKQMAQAKGITLPEQGGAVPNLGQTGIQPNTQPDEQPQPSLMSKVTGFFSNIFNGAKQGAINGAEYIAENNPITRAAADIQGSGVKGGLTKFASDTTNQALLNAPRIEKNAQGQKGFNPGSATQAAIGGLSAPEEIWDVDTIRGLAAESDPAKIVKTLTDKGVDPEAAQKISPLISAVNNPAQVEQILHSANDFLFPQPKLLM